MPLHQVWDPGRVEEESVGRGERLERGRVWCPGLEHLDELDEERSKPAGVMTSIIRASVGPAFHIVWSSPRGLLM